MDPTTIAQMLMAYAQPARPVTPTPMTADDLADALYGSGTAPAPLPSGLPQNVQDYIRNHPSYAEGQTQTITPLNTGEASAPPTPQIADIQRLFNRRIMQNAPRGNPIGGPLLKSIVQTGHLAGGDEI